MKQFEEIVRDVLGNPANQGEMEDADAVGTVGSAECGDMMRMWLKFAEKDGKRVIDRASFQAFGCQTAMAVASMATDLLRGKTAEEAASLSAAELAGNLGPLPPMKIHCGQLVEGALKNALEQTTTARETGIGSDDLRNTATTLSQELQASETGKLKIVPL